MLSFSNVGEDFGGLVLCTATAIMCSAIKRLNRQRYPKVASRESGLLSAILLH